jgi:hypothetical protein
MSKKYAFVLMHFGNDKKYLELELYLLINLREYTTHDIIYMYSIHDTPIEFIEIVTEYCTKVIPYDDNNITYNIEYDSHYTHFNLLRTCNFLFAYQLTDYYKICIIESDMMIIQNLDSIFKLNTPSILTYYDKVNILRNNKIVLNEEQIHNACSHKTEVNGGVLLFKPSIVMFEKYKKNVEIIIKNNCTYPNEALFLLTNNIIYNLKYIYNGTYFHLSEIGKTTDLKNILCIVHLFLSKYKQIDRIRDGFIEKLNDKKNKNYNPLLYNFINSYKTKYYDEYHTEIDSQLQLIENL